MWVYALQADEELADRKLRITVCKIFQKPSARKWRAAPNPVKLGSWYAKIPCKLPVALKALKLQKPCWIKPNLHSFLLFLPLKMTLSGLPWHFFVHLTHPWGHICPKASDAYLRFFFCQEKCWCDLHRISRNDKLNMGRAYQSSIALILV